MLRWQNLATLQEDAGKLKGYQPRIRAAQRAKVPGGWLVCVLAGTQTAIEGGGLTFYPDPEHQWDGKSLS